MDKLQFLLEARAQIFAAHKKSLLLPGEGRRFVYETKEFVYTHIQFGFSPFKGEEIIYKKWPDETFTAIWSLNYGGATLDFVKKQIKDGRLVERIINFLRMALMEVDENFPFRGPEVFASEKFVYRSQHSSGTDYFSGQEKITLDGVTVYEGNFFGGEIIGRETFNFDV